MKGLLDYDGYLNRLLTKVMYIVAVNLLFLICSLPVFTVGASCTAMYAVLFRYLQGDEPDIIRIFLREFRGSFKKATLIWTGMLAVLCTLGLNYFMLYQLEGIWTEAVRIFLNFILFLLIIVWTYGYPAVSCYQNSTGGYVQFAVRAAIGNLPVTAVVVLLQTLPIFGILFLSQFLQTVVLLLICCGFSLPAYLSGHLLLKVFKRYEGRRECDISG